LRRTFSSYLSFVEPAHNSVDILQFFKTKFREEFVDIAKFKNDLAKTYISEFFVDELRSYYTEQERTKFLIKANANKVVRQCDGLESQVCFRRIHEYSLEKHGQSFNVFKTERPLDNLKLYHFHFNDVRKFEVMDRRYVGERSREKRENSAQRKPAISDIGETFNRHDSNMTTQGSEGDPTESLSHELLIERQTHSCDFKEGKEQVMRRVFKKRAELMDELVMLEQGVVQDTLEQLLAYQFKRREVPDWDELVLSHANSKDDSHHPEGKALVLDTREQCDTDEEIEDNDMIDIMENANKPIDFQQPEDGSTTTGHSDSRRGTEMSNMGGFIARDTEGTQISEESDSQGPGKNELGLFGIDMQDPEDDGETLLPHQNNMSSSRFSFLDSNLDKFTVLQYLEDQALNISKIASNVKPANKSEES